VTADFRPVAALLDEAKSRRAFPAAAIEVGRCAGALWRSAVGRLTYLDQAPSATPETIFDLASLTKVLAATPLVMRLVGQRRLLLNARVGAFLPDWRGGDRDSVTVADLLEHASGLTAWWDLYRRAATRREFAHEISGLPLEYPPRTRSVYSDLGFILLGLILEEIDGRPLDVQFAATFGRPDLTFRPPKGDAARTAPTEEDRGWRGRLLTGEVHDENAWALGGVAGHAGLFGTVGAVGDHARLVLRTLEEPTALGEPWLLRRFLTPSRVPGSSRALGWDLMRPASSCGSRISRAAFGHTGFTGTSLWIDPLKDLYVVLLTNRVHPARPAEQPDELARLRPRVHDAVVSVLAG
jgi:CubicO group peptidase (beta-lactamase class C family)